MDLVRAASAAAGGKGGGGRADMAQAGGSDVTNNRLGDKFIVDLADVLKRKKMALDAFPRSFRRNRHAFVAVACRTAGRKGVAKPKAVFRSGF